MSFVDPNFGLAGRTLENDEHPPTDIQRGQFYVSQVINAVRNGPFWRDSIIFLTYDEPGGFYKHAKPADAPQEDARIRTPSIPASVKTFPTQASSQGEGQNAP